MKWVALCSALLVSSGCYAQTPREVKETEIDAMRNRWTACVNKAYLNAPGATLDEVAEGALLACQAEERAMLASLARYGFPNIDQIAAQVRTGKKAQLISRTRPAVRNNGNSMPKQ
jgi:hypothetical protein